MGLGLSLIGILKLISTSGGNQSMAAAAAAASSAPVSPTAEQLMQRRELHAAQSTAQARPLRASLPYPCCTNCDTRSPMHAW